MSELRGWGLPESHLLPDAVVAFVDQELSIAAHERAASHIARCPGCAADVAAQRQARSAVQTAHAPSMSAGFLASLRSIPQDTELSTSPDNLAMTEDGQLVTIQRPDRVAGLRGAVSPSMLGGTAPLGQVAPLGNSPNVLGGGSRLNTGGTRRRAAQGAGVVVSGLVLSALALVATSGANSAEVPREPSGQLPPAGVRAQLGGAASVPTSAPATTTTTPAPADDLLVGRP
ncbi:hypothetical protein SAMN05216266_115133 [Amycolatopsis marina]|uniref:Zinc-finger n=1 Tax=Amycolatopsis marina TaxID=490629 RepID=A0A1I1BMR5_9PSEU|nr:hypothetical protein [Amycolatopsis marina]SFB51665.1 hypothetical protein SAMN05216266_115133 [Amycolatopsis marina]